MKFTIDTDKILEKITGLSDKLMDIYDTVDEKIDNTLEQLIPNKPKEKVVYNLQEDEEQLLKVIVKFNEARLEKGLKPLNPLHLSDDFKESLTEQLHDLYEILYQRKVSELKNKTKQTDKILKEAKLKEEEPVQELTDEKIQQLKEWADNNGAE